MDSEIQVPNYCEPTPLGTARTDFSTKKWCDEEIQTIRDGLKTGKSFSIIAGELKRSRSAVIGKAHRLGLCHTIERRGPIAETRLMPVSRHRQNPIVKSRLKWPSMAEARRTADSRPRLLVKVKPRKRPQLLDAHHCTLMELNGHTCRWPHGDPGTPNFFFCGAEPEVDAPYCPYHCKAAYASQACVD